MTDKIDTSVLTISRIVGHKSAIIVSPLQKDFGSLFYCCSVLFGRIVGTSTNVLSPELIENKNRLL